MRSSHPDEIIPMSIEPRAEELIKKYLTGSLSESEVDNLVNWIRSDNENLSYFRKCCRSWEGSEDISLERSYNHLVSKRMLREAAENTVAGAGSYQVSFLFRKYSRRFMKYAAVFMVGILATILLQLYISNNRKMENAVQWVCAETATGQKARLVLPDSSVVWLNAETRISFPSDFAAQRERVVTLEGEAYFQVQDQKSRHFTVRCRDYEVRVKGTEFNVMAYEDFNRTEATLVRGAITVIRDNKSVDVSPGERVVYSDNSLVKSNAHIRQATLWKENKFYFDNVPFRELIRRLERWYDVDITLSGEQLDKIYYSGYFKNEETVWQVLDVIQLTTPIQYERKDFREIIIKIKPMK
jgi:transmembrane sensor